MPPVSKKVRAEITKRDGYSCQICGRKLPADLLHPDHIIPRSKGGTDDPSNLQAACPTCNSVKGNRGADCRCGQFVTARAKFCQGCGAPNIPANHKSHGKSSISPVGAGFNLEIFRKIGLAFAIFLILVGLGFIRC